MTEDNKIFDFTSFEREMERERQIFDIRSIRMKANIEQLQEDNCDNSIKLRFLEIGLTKLKEENDDLRKRLKNCEEKTNDKIREAKCELSNQILKCELTENHYSLELKRFEDKLEDQFLYMKKYNENNENSFMKLFWVTFGVSWGFILAALFQIFLFHL